MLLQSMHKQGKKCQNYSYTKLFVRYFKVESLRIIRSVSSYVAILAIAVTLRLVAQLSNPGSDILGQIYISSYLSIFIIVFAVAGIGNGNVLRIQSEHKYNVALIQRGELQPYIDAVICANFLFTIFYMVLGGILFAISYGGSLPLVDISDSITDSFCSNSIWSKCTRSGYYGITYIMQLIWFGLLAGILSTCSVYLSYRVKNQMFSIVFPSACYYGIVTYLNQFGAQLYMFRPYDLFIASYNIWKNAVITIIWDLCICGGILVLMERIIYHRMRKDLEG